VTDDQRLVIDLLAYAEEHALDVDSLLLVLAWSSGRYTEDDPGEPLDVPPHYYPH
jgi:hypothetical protein